jgi:CRISPR-associated protein Csx16
LPLLLCHCRVTQASFESLYFSDCRPSEYQAPCNHAIRSQGESVTIFFVSRHIGAKEWAARHNVAAEIIAHLDPSCVQTGDVVIGTLPAHLAAQICRTGARYVHLAMNVPQHWRGRDLSADDMDACAATLLEIHCAIVGPYQPAGQ